MSFRATRTSTTLAIALLLFSGVVSAKDNQYKHKQRAYEPRHDLYEYATVLDTRPIFREVKVSKPIRECWDEPVYHTRRGQISAGGMLAGGLIGGIVGHQIGNGRGNKVATAMGTLIGAQIGHQVVNADVKTERTLTGYEEHCKTYHRVVVGQPRIDGYSET